MTALAADGHLAPGVRGVPELVEPASGFAPRARRLLDADAELAGSVPSEDRDRARRGLVVAVHRLPEGRVDLAALELPPTTFALLALEGLMTLDVAVAGHPLSELLVEGDVLAPSEPAIGGVPTARSLTALTPVELAVLDHRFSRAAAAWPGLMVAVHQRLCDQQHRVATHGAICQLPRVQDRILAVLWHLAGLVGRVGPEGTRVPLRLTHQALGQLCGARRPTVTLAVGALCEEGLLRRDQDGTWVLPRDQEDGPVAGSGALRHLAAA